LWLCYADGLAWGGNSANCHVVFHEADNLVGSEGARGAMMGVILEDYVCWQIGVPDLMLAMVVGCCSLLRGE